MTILRRRKWKVAAEHIETNNAVDVARRSTNDELLCMYRTIHTSFTLPQHLEKRDLEKNNLWQVP